MDLPVTMDGLIESTFRHRSARPKFPQDGRVAQTRRSYPGCARRPDESA